MMRFMIHGYDRYCHCLQLGVLQRRLDLALITGLASHEINSLWLTHQLVLFV